MEDRLRKFARVVETRSFTQASRELRISQPALSTAIRKLERELKVGLFTRRIPPLKLTSAGAIVYRYAKSLDARNSNFKLELAELNRQKPNLAIGMIDSIAQTLFVQNDYLTSLKQQARITLSVNNSRILMSSLEQGSLDMALVTLPSQPVPQFIRLRQLGTEPLVGVATPRSAEDAKEAIRSNILPNLLSYDLDSNTSRLIQQYLTSQGIETETTFRSTSPEILLRLALSGEGVAILPYLMVRDALLRKSLVPVIGPIDRPTIAFEHKDRTTALPLLILCKNLQKLLGELTAASNSLF